MSARTAYRFLALIITIAAFPLPLRAQAPGVPIEPTRVFAPRPAFAAQLTALHDQGKLLSMDDVDKILAHPTPAKIILAPTSTQAMPSQAIPARIRKSFLRVGWCFPSRGPRKWDINVADAYILTPDGVAATAYHVLQPPRHMQSQAWLFAQDTAGKVYPITQVLCGDELMDDIIFRLADASGLTPLGINDQTVPGARVYLLSDPSWVAGYFSSGVIDRFYWDAGRSSGDPMSLKDARRLRMNVSTDWAPGSSGAPIVDDCCNVVGHVSKISVITAPSDDTNDGATTRPAAEENHGVGTYMSLHEASPVRGIRLLIDQMNNPATPATQSTTANK